MGILSQTKDFVASTISTLSLGIVVPRAKLTNTVGTINSKSDPKYGIDKYAVLEYSQDINGRIEATQLDRFFAYDNIALMDFSKLSEANLLNLLKILREEGLPKNIKVIQLNNEHQSNDIKIALVELINTHRYINQLELRYSSDQPNATLDRVETLGSVLPTLPPTPTPAATMPSFVVVTPSTTPAPVTIPTLIQRLIINSRPEGVDLPSRLASYTDKEIISSLENYVSNVTFRFMESKPQVLVDEFDTINSWIYNRSQSETELDNWTKCLICKSLGIKYEIPKYSNDLDEENMMQPDAADGYIGYNEYIIGIAEGLGLISLPTSLISPPAPTPTPTPAPTPTPIPTPTPASTPLLLTIQSPLDIGPTTDLSTLNKTLDSIEKDIGKSIWCINRGLMSICDKLDKRESVGIDAFSNYGIEVRFTTQAHLPNADSKIPTDGTITHYKDQFLLHTLSSPLGHPIKLILKVTDPSQFWTKVESTQSQPPLSQSSPPKNGQELKDRYQAALIKDKREFVTVMEEILKSSKTAEECLDKIVEDLRGFGMKFQISKPSPDGWAETFKNPSLVEAREWITLFNFIVENMNLSSSVDQSTQPAPQQAPVAPTLFLMLRTPTVPIALPLLDRITAGDLSTLNNLFDSVQKSHGGSEWRINPKVMSICQDLTKGEKISIDRFSDCGLEARYIKESDSPGMEHLMLEGETIMHNRGQFLHYESSFIGQPITLILQVIDPNQFWTRIEAAQSQSSTPMQIVTNTVTSSNIPTIPPEVKDLLDVETKVTYQDIKNLGYEVDLTHNASPYNLYSTDLISLHEDGHLIFKGWDGKDIATTNFPLNPNVEFRKIINDTNPLSSGEISNIIKFTEATKGADSLLHDLSEELRPASAGPLTDDCKKGIAWTKDSAGISVIDFLGLTGLKAPLAESTIIKDEAGQWMVDGKPTDLVFEVVDPAKVWKATS